MAVVHVRDEGVVKGDAELCTARVAAAVDAHEHQLPGELVAGAPVRHVERAHRASLGLDLDHVGRERCVG